MLGIRRASGTPIVLFSVMGAAILYCVASFSYSRLRANAFEAAFIGVGGEKAPLGLRYIQINSTTGTPSLAAAEILSTISENLAGAACALNQDGSVRRALISGAGASGVLRDLVECPTNVNDAIRVLISAVEKVQKRVGSDKQRELSDAIRPLTEGWSRWLGFLFGWEQLFSYILTAWGVLFLLRENARLRLWKKDLDDNYLGLENDEMLNPVLAREKITVLRHALDSVSNRPHPAIVLDSLRRFVHTQDISATSALALERSQLYETEVDNELGPVRFCIWAIPSIGFIGTVRGIGLALANASSSDRLPDVVGALGIAFDTTLVALLLSIVLQLMMFRFTRRLGRFTLDLVHTLRKGLIDRLNGPEQAITT